MTSAREWCMPALRVSSAVKISPYNTLGAPKPHSRVHLGGSDGYARIVVPSHMLTEMLEDMETGQRIKVTLTIQDPPPEGWPRGRKDTKT